MKTRMLVAAGAVAAIVVALAGAGAAVWAQGQGMGPHGPFGHMGGFGPFGIHQGLRQLDLTDEQKVEIKAILKSHHEELLDSLGKLKALHQTVGNIPRQKEIDAVLTPEQRQKAEALHEKLRSHVEEMRKSMHEIGNDLLEDPS